MPYVESVLALKGLPAVLWGSVSALRPGSHAWLQLSAVPDEDDVWD